MARNFRFRPYYGIRINRRGIRPYAGIGCLALAAFAFAAVLLALAL
jgi:hypothetical protein